MTLTRYNEIMDRVEVTPEMRKRVLANAAAASAKPGKRRSPWKPLISCAACLVVILLASLALPKLDANKDPSVPTTQDLAQWGWQAVDYASAAELSEAAGFAVQEPPALRDAAQEAQYTLISGSLAQISYTVGDEIYTYRVSRSSEDNSGDYNEYEAERSDTLGGVSVCYKGSASACWLALWEANGFSRSLSASDGIPYADMEAYVRSVLNE